MAISGVLDASAMLALLDGEPGAEIVKSVLANAAISTVNLAEAYGKVAERGDQAIQALMILHELIGEVVPFNADHAVVAGKLRPSTRSLGLSLGDRACLTLGIVMGVEVYTADLAWAGLQVGCKIHLIR